MKCLILFMAALMFTLTFVDLCNAGKEACISANAVQQGPDHDDEKPEVCSPFCSCARCTFSVLIPQKVPGHCIIISYLTRVVCYREGHPVAASIPVWQPPKVV